jgi:peptidyl-prolyl cis-trans isomerase B (cyclophilin B)
MKLLYRHLAPLFFASFSLAANAEGGAAPQVKLETSMGDIVIELNQEKAPNTVANFISYVEDGFYNGTIFHRVIENFMVQGGGFDENFDQKKTKAPIENEADKGLSNKRGSIAMARTNDPHSATAQFFINTVDNDFLDFRGKAPSGWGYAVFGEVIEGMDVVDKIRKVKTTMRGPHQDVPAENVVIIKASVL